MNNFENEVWKPIEGYEGLYEVSSFGNVKRLRNVNKEFGRKYYISEKLLNQSTDNDGYKKVHLQKDGNSKTIRVHRLVASAFIPNPENKEQVNHINGIKDDNNYKNLEWSTPSENTKHAFKTGLAKTKKVERIDDLGNVKIFNSLKEAAVDLGYIKKNRLISLCCLGHKKSAYGYKWRYIEGE